MSILHQSPTISNGVPRNELAQENRLHDRESNWSPAVRGGICIQTQTVLTSRVSAGPTRRLPPLLEIFKSDSNDQIQKGGAPQQRG